MATSPPASARRPAVHITFCLALTLLTFISGQATYLYRADAVSVAIIAVSYVALLLLFALRLVGGDGGSSTQSGLWPQAAVLCPMLLVSVLLVCKVSRMRPLPTWSALLMAAAGATAALGIGGCCAFLLHRLSISWSKEPCQGAMLPLEKERAGRI